MTDSPLVRALTPPLAPHCPVDRPPRPDERSTDFGVCDVAIVVADARTRVIAVNQAYAELTGDSVEATLGRPLRSLCPIDSGAALVAEVRAGLARADRWHGEVLQRHRSGRLYPAWMSVKAVRGEGGKVERFVATLSDISDLRREDERLRHLAHHDPLTGLPNRLLFDSELLRCIARAKRKGQQFALLFIDVDHFKDINDSLGHAGGDHVLREVGRRLTQAVRASDLVARLGGDEFTVVLEDLPDEAEAARLAAKILSAIALPMAVEGHLMIVTCSIGVAFFPADAVDGDALIRAADEAMYRVKHTGRGAFAVTAFG